jgi:hypothetical protein
MSAVLLCRLTATGMLITVILVNIPVAVSQQRKTADMCEGHNYIGQHSCSGKSAKHMATGMLTNIIVTFKYLRSPRLWTYRYRDVDQFNCDLHTCPPSSCVDIPLQEWCEGHNYIGQHSCSGKSAKENDGHM